MHMHGRAGKPKQLARNAKNPGKTRVLQHGLQKANGEDRNRTFGYFPYDFGSSKGTERMLSETTTPSLIGGNM
jgi:hypothetical protein